MTSETATDAAAAIRDYVRKHMSALSETDLHDDDDIFERGFVTSIFAMQLLDFLETTFGVEIPDDRITLRNFSSVNRMTAMVGTLTDDTDG